MEKRKFYEDDVLEKDAYDTRMAFGHDIPHNIEIEPYSYPSISLSNTRVLKKVEKKQH